MSRLDRAVDAEHDRIEQDYQDGFLTREQRDQEMGELARQYRDEVEAEAQEAYYSVMDDYGMRY